MALIVIEVFIRDRGMSAKSARTSPRCEDRDTDLADLASGERVVGVVAGLGRQVEGDREPGLALVEVAPVERVVLAAALEWPAYVRITQGLSRSARPWG